MQVYTDLGIVSGTESAKDLLYKAMPTMITACSWLSVLGSAIEHLYSDHLCDLYS